MSEERKFGTVKWFNSEIGYGFIKDGEDPDTEYFVHYSSIEMEDPKAYKKLNPDQDVSFVLEDTSRGIQAKEVRIEN